MTTPPLSTIAGGAKGVVAPGLAGRTFRMARYAPGPALAHALDHYWVVEWDLGARPPFVQRTLPYPCVHVVFDRARSGIWGVPTGPFDYTLAGAGKVCGLRFKAGAFRAVLGRPLHTNRRPAIGNGPRHRPARPGKFCIMRIGSTTSPGPIQPFPIRPAA